MKSISKTNHAPTGLTSGLLSLVAAIISAVGLRSRGGQWLLVLSVLFTGAALPSEAFAQAPPQAPPNSSLFSPQDILNPPALVRKLSAHSDPVSAFVWTQLPAAVQQALTQTPAPLPGQVTALVDGLNSILAGSSIYDSQRFAGVALSPGTRLLVAQAPQPGENLVRLNRLLLEDAYRLQLRKSPPQPLALPTGTSVSTDQADYAPGTTAHIRGREFQAGETVRLQVLHADGTSDGGADHLPWTVVAGTNGGFQATWHVCEDDCVGSTLKLTATGESSGKIAQATFTDAPGAPTYEQVKSFGKPASGSGPWGRLIQGTDGALYGTAASGGSGGAGTVFRLNPDGTGFAVLKNFDLPTTGGYLYAGLIQGTDGALYGTATYGGDGGFGSGTVFKLNPDGTGFAVLKSFDYYTTGGYLYAGVIQGPDGALYGTAYSGGSSAGTVFKLNPDGTGFVVLKNLDYSTGDNPYAGLLYGADGALYGAGSSGGSSGFGTVFKLNPDGTGFIILKNFDYSTSGGYLSGTLLPGADGMLYGTASSGGGFGSGTVFKLNPDGTDFTVIKNLDYSTSGGNPDSGLMQGADGTFYGTATAGGGFGYGTVFKLNPDGTDFTVIKNLDYFTGATPVAGLVQGTDGALYGTASSGGSSGYGTVFKLKPDGTDFIVLKNLSSSSDITESGGYLQAGLIQGADDALYGTTSQGGSSGAGTVFKLNLDGTGFAILKNFDFFTTGNYIQAGLVQGADGALYGTALQGGGIGYGTVFKLNRDGTDFTVLKDFDYYPSGGFPYAGLMQGADGALYGTTWQGGSSGAGTVFKLNPNGTGFTILKSFDNSASGGYPRSGLMQGTDGLLYGTASSGGSSGSGTIFRLNPNGTGFTVLKNFDYYTTGGNLYAELIQGPDGSLYGTADQGGSGGGGTVFKLNPDGTGFTVLRNFDFSTTGGYLNSKLARGPDGGLYGAALYGGTSSAGTLFRLNPDGTDFSILKQFDTSTSGGYPYAGLVLATDGNLYGTTYQGGDANAGTVFRLAFPPGGPANTPPVARCKDVMVSAGASCTAAASIDDGSFDPDTGDTITVTQTPAGPYPLGPTSVTLTVTDNHGAASTCIATVTVRDTTAPTITCPANLSVGCSVERLATVSYSAPTVFDNCDAHPTVTCTPASGSASFAVGVNTVACTAVDASGNRATCSFTVTRAALGFTGFSSPIGGEVAMGTGGSFSDPLRAFKLGSTIPVKFLVSCGGTSVATGVHTLQATKYSNSVDSDPVIDATPTDSATTGNQFRLTDAASGEWHFNLNTKLLSVGTWKLTATLSDGTIHEVWITIKK